MDVGQQRCRLRCTTIARSSAAFTREAVVVFGDMPKDIPTLEWAGHGTSLPAGSVQREERDGEECQPAVAAPAQP